jgi:hypothetical protein
MDKRARNSGILQGLRESACCLEGLQVGNVVVQVLRSTNYLFSCLREARQTEFTTQAAVIDLLITGHASDIDDRGLAELLRTAFSNFVAGTALNRLDSAPKHTPNFYLRIWWALYSNNAGPVASSLPQALWQPLTHAQSSQVHTPMELVCSTNILIQSTCARSVIYCRLDAVSSQHCQG